MNTRALLTTSRYRGLAGCTVLITGGATGIGASLVVHFVAQGAKVGYVDLAVEAGEALAASLAAADHPPLFIAADITDIDALQAAIAQVRARLGPITVLLNNAANDQRHSVATVARKPGRMTAPASIQSR